jgi:hypothetical protein
MINQKPKIVRDGKVIMVGQREEDDGVEMGSVAQTKPVVLPPENVQAKPVIQESSATTRQELPGEIGVRGRLVYLVVVEEPHTPKFLTQIKVGTENYSPTPEDLEAVKSVFDKVMDSKNMRVYTGHDINIETIPMDAEYVERAFVTSKLDRTASCIEISGFEIETREQFNAISKMNSYSEIVDLANTHKLVLKNMVYPYNRVISIQNLTYQPKNK